MAGCSMNLAAGPGQNGPRKKLPEASVPVFQEGIYLILSRWSALRLALENEWGGRGSSDLAYQLGSNIFSWFTVSKEPLYIDDLENILDEGMLFLNTEVEDGSVEEVAEKLMIMHEECLEGNYSTIEKLRQAGPVTAAHQHVRQAADDDDDDNDDDEGEDEGKDNDRSNMMMGAPQSESKPNPVNTVNERKAKDTQSEDGWEVVSSRRNRGKRN